MKCRNSFLIGVILIANVSFGQVALNFTITDTKGESWNLFDELAKGKTVVLDFFFVNCSPCQELTPAMAKLYSDFDKDEVLVLGISDRDLNDKIIEFETQYGVNYPSAGIEGGGDTITDLYKSWFAFVGWPTYAVVCPNRQIQWNLDRDTNFIEVRKEILNCVGTLSNEKMPLDEFLIYPNPVSSNSKVVLPLQNKSSEVKLTSLTGQLIFECKLSDNLLYIPSCSNGVYYLEVIQNNRVYHSRIRINNY